eukprot:CAMPEP_0115172602 /NCGR_PEP_ID=MMETSP0270-20121206/2899_1 /TAXON_ID=71861 /ORGANISM="Scrippsiella trochoidea, Strain CCMP3099" /LENGTH=61 /DNA_ID=CAMNT_0002585397 /DNA_START=549 /DNA_END=734 /DNA_ORIENTATION=+
MPMCEVWTSRSPVSLRMCRSPGANQKSASGKMMSTIAHAQLPTDFMLPNMSTAAPDTCGGV